MSAARFGLSCALATPFARNGAIDLAGLVRHAKRVRAAGCASVTLFGTTGEGASVGLRERAEALGALAGAGFDPSSEIVLTLAASAGADLLEQVRVGEDFGVGAFLFTPPYYFKNLSDEGLYAWYARALERMAGGARVILYNLPSVTGVLLTPNLIGRLKGAFAGLVTGVKDSGGDWAYTSALLDVHADLTILVGDERHLAAAMRRGASGAISGVANLEAARLARMIETGRDDEAISALVEAIVAQPVIPAIKALLAAALGEPGWSDVRPPLVPVAGSAAAALAARHAELFPR